MHHNESISDQRQHIMYMKEINIHKTYTKRHRLHIYTLNFSLDSNDTTQIFIDATMQVYTKFWPIYIYITSNKCLTKYTHKTLVLFITYSYDIMYVGSRQKNIYITKCLGIGYIILCILDIYWRFNSFWNKRTSSIEYQYI